jgi:hypothetical protein
VVGAKSVCRGGGGLFAGGAVAGFAGVGLVESRAVPPPATVASRTYSGLYDAGVGIITRHRINDLAWTMRFELPLIVSRWEYAADWNGKPEGRLAFRWQASLEPSY